MARTVVIGTALLSLVLLAPVRAALAKEPAEPAEPAEPGAEDAASLVEKGIALRHAGEDAQALPLFERAEKLDPSSVRVKVHLAAAHQALGEWEEADRYLTAALQDPTDAYIQRHERTLAAARRTIDGHIGTLRLIGGPPGTEVRLNGRLLGTLPLGQTIRVEAGIYSLEATLPGHYPVTRSVALAGGTSTRESIQLALLSAPSSGGEQVRASSGGSNWLTWTFGGLALGAGAATAVAWTIREKHANAWNDDSQCLIPGRTRESVCGDELDAGKRAETGMWIGAGATLVFAVASVSTLWFNGDSSEAPSAALGCGLGLGQIACSGRF
jgi:tetratricopeptide (TPR) repeat protein